MSRERETYRTLQALMSGKRNESPAPGYFSHFSDQVIARIEHDERVRRMGWLPRILDRWDLRPVVAFGCGVSAALVLAILISGEPGTMTPGYGLTSPTDTVSVGWVDKAPAFSRSSDSRSSVDPVIHVSLRPSHPATPGLR